MQKVHTDKIVDAIRDCTSLDALDLVHKIGRAVISHARANDDDQLRLAAHRIQHMAQRRARALRGDPYVTPAGVIDFPHNRKRS